MSFQLPSKTELKQRYGITNDDFAVLTANSTPEPDAHSTVEASQDWQGIKTFVRRSRMSGVVMAVVLVFTVAWAGLTLPARVEKELELGHKGFNHYATLVETMQKARHTIPPSAPVAWPSDFSRQYAMTGNANVATQGITMLSVGSNYVPVQWV